MGALSRDRGAGKRPLHHAEFLVPAYRLGWNSTNETADLALLRRTVEDFRQVEKCVLGDFYPLTPYSVADNAWLAWQYARPEAGEGVIQAFRRDHSPDEAMVLKLHGLQPKTVYELKDADRGGTVRLPGRELMTKGLPVNLGPRQAALIFYRQVKGTASPSGGAAPRP